MTPSISAGDKPVAADVPNPPNPVARFFSMENPYLAPILITCILVAGHLTYGFLEAVPKTALAIITAIVTEMVLGLIILKRIPPLASAYVTGISCGILIRSPEWWPYAMAAAIATTSKYVIRIDNRHLWNPSNLAIVILLIVAHDSVATLSVQWGNDLLPVAVVWLLGSVIISRLKRFHICATYVVSFVFFAWIRSLITGGGTIEAFRSEVSPITGPMYQLFIFFMITDPKTTTKSPRVQMLVAFLIAATECILRLLPHFQSTPAIIILASHAPYFALTIMGPLSNLIEIYQQRKAKKEAAIRPAGSL
jgi:enediyne biosynthesis protein E5